MATTNLVPCPDCGHLLSRLAPACPSCARPVRPAAPCEGLFLRTLNQLVAVAFWGPLLWLLIAFLGGLAGVFLFRPD